MKQCLYIHQNYQSPKLSLYMFVEISCEKTHFSQVLYAKCYCKTMANVFYGHFSTDDACRLTYDFHGKCSHLQITPQKNFNCVR